MVFSTYHNLFQSNIPAKTLVANRHYVRRTVIKMGVILSTVAAATTPETSTSTINPLPSEVPETSPPPYPSDCFNFMGLPLEVRLLIYQILARDTSVVISDAPEESKEEPQQSTIERITTSLLTRLSLKSSAAATAPRWPYTIATEGVELLSASQIIRREALSTFLPVKRLITCPAALMHESFPKHLLREIEGIRLMRNEGVIGARINIDRNTAIEGRTMLIFLAEGELPFSTDIDSLRFMAKTCLHSRTVGMNQISAMMWSMCALASLKSPQGQQEGRTRVDGQYGEQFHQTMLSLFPNGMLCALWCVPMRLLQGEPPGEVVLKAVSSIHSRALPAVS